MNFQEEYKSRGSKHYMNEKKNKKRDHINDGFGINVCSYGEFTLKNRDYNPLRTHTKSRLKNKKNWEDFEMPFLSHSKYVKLKDICPCCQHIFPTHKII